MLLLDTSAVSAFMHRDPSALHRLRGEDPSTVYLCTPVAAEICFGLSRLRAGSRRQRLLADEFARLRGALRWADWSEPASLVFGQWKATLQQRGTPIEDMDLAIASIALSLPARLATCKMRHFARIDDLELVDWSGSERS
ncbi:MAG: type II toxin-antitoxin system VapC family toxin [Bryobacterales bacterium]|nr:type II toxin-antitoxin system VapC family toxin [Bryobacterales bacterium]MDE0622607.1 type II toxin-antitoxin system VapC family toxin [Bryobacterales bacterium]